MGQSDGRSGRPRARRAPSGALEDPVSQQLAALIVLSLAALWVLVWVRSGTISAPIALGLDADGLVSQMGDATTIWRVPVVATLLGVMSMVTGLLVASHELFAGRFVLGMGVWVQILAWVAAVTLLW
ncbi:MAG TPA: hypothetical protein VGT61_03855 [Thermomicrobiales bacterium]|nr:hypothetical protein [Thermomicrobiales bacterium]